MSNNLNQLQLQLAAIQEQQRLQTFMIKQFQEQLFLPISSDEDDDSSPLDLSSTSIKSDEDQSTSVIEFQMESHEGEPENPNMSKVC
jgi:hypothetical protein